MKLTTGKKQGVSMFPCAVRKIPFLQGPREEVSREKDGERTRRNREPVKNVSHLSP